MKTKLPGKPVSHPNWKSAQILIEEALAPIRDQVDAGLRENENLRGENAELRARLEKAENIASHWKNVEERANAAIEWQLKAEKERDEARILAQKNEALARARTRDVEAHERHLLTRIYGTAPGEGLVGALDKAERERDELLAAAHGLTGVYDPINVENTASMIRGLSSERDTLRALNADAKTYILRIEAERDALRNALHTDCGSCGTPTEPDIRVCPKCLDAWIGGKGCEFLDKSQAPLMALLKKTEAEVAQQRNLREAAEKSWDDWQKAAKRANDEIVHWQQITGFHDPEGLDFFLGRMPLTKHAEVQADIVGKAHQRVKELEASVEEQANEKVKAIGLYGLEHIRVAELERVLDRAVEGFEAVRRSNLQRGHAACDEILPELRAALAGNEKS